MNQVLIVTVSDDIHSMAIARELASRPCTRCTILELDRISVETAMSWRSDSEALELSLPDGRRVDVAELDAIWWRRTRASQNAPRATRTSAPGQALVDSDCAAAMLGALQTGFRGIWVSDPLATTRAANKLLQLRVAQRNGFYVPRTLVSNDPDEVLAFLESMPGRAIVKPVAGTKEAVAYTRFVSRDSMTTEDIASLSLCPATFQEYVPGEVHVRLNMFGRTPYAALIRSKALDWRPDLRVPVTMTELPDDVVTTCGRVLDELDLRMGIIDLKRRPDGEYVWLEVNPQGQFLFLEGITGAPLTARFADFLIETCEQAERVARSGLPVFGLTTE